MLDEERHAIEVHLLSCSLCYQALLGLETNPQARASLSALNSGFLKEHFGLQYPEVQVSALATSTRARRPRWTRGVIRAKGGEEVFRMPASWVMLLAMGAGLGIYLYAGRPSWGDMKSYLYHADPLPSSDPQEGPGPSQQALSVFVPGADSSRGDSWAPPPPSPSATRIGLRKDEHPGAMDFMDPTIPGQDSLDAADSLPSLGIKLPPGPGPQSLDGLPETKLEVPAGRPLPKKVPNPEPEPRREADPSAPARQADGDSAASPLDSVRQLIDEGNYRQARELLEPMRESRGREKRQAKRWIREIDQKEKQIRSKEETE